MTRDILLDPLQSDAETVFAAELVGREQAEAFDPRGPDRLVDSPLLQQDVPQHRRPGSPAVEHGHRRVALGIGVDQKRPQSVPGHPDMC